MCVQGKPQRFSKREKDREREIDFFTHSSYENNRSQWMTKVKQENNSLALQIDERILQWRSITVMKITNI